MACFMEVPADSTCNKSPLKIASCFPLWLWSFLGGLVCSWHADCVDWRISWIVRLQNRLLLPGKGKVCWTSRKNPCCCIAGRWMKADAWLFGDGCSGPSGRLAEDKRELHVAARITQDVQDMHKSIITLLSILANELIIVTNEESQIQILVKLLCAATDIFRNSCCRKVLPVIVITLLVPQLSLLQSFCSNQCSACGWGAFVARVVAHNQGTQKPISHVASIWIDMCFERENVTSQNVGIPLSASAGDCK